MNDVQNKTTIRAFLSGMQEFRTDTTTSYDDLQLQNSYDWGREWAHRLTLRYFDSDARRNG